MTTETRKSTINTGVKIGKSIVYVVPTGVRIGARGRVTRDVTPILQQISKGHARRIRKALRKQGLYKMAGAKRF